MSLTVSSRVSVRIGEIAQHEELIAHIAARAREDPKTLRWNAYQVSLGEAGRYLYVSRAESLAEIAMRESVPAVVRRLFGERRGGSLIAEANRGIDSMQTLVFRPREDLSYPPEPDSPPAPFVLRTRIRICSGGQEACEELLRKVAEAVIKLDDERRFTTLEALIGDMMEYSIARPVFDPIQLDPESSVAELLDQAFGSVEGRSLLRSGRSVMDELQADLLIHRPDLSSPERVD